MKLRLITDNNQGTPISHYSSETDQNDMTQIYGQQRMDVSTSVVSMKRCVVNTIANHFKLPLEMSQL